MNTATESLSETPAESALTPEQAAPAQNAMPLEEAEETSASPAKEWPFPENNEAPARAKKAALAQRSKKTGKANKQTVGEASKPEEKTTDSSGSAAGGRKKPAAPIAYRCPGSGMTWSGRGKKPAWVQAHLLAGGSPADLLATERCPHTADMLNGAAA